MRTLIYQSIVKLPVMQQDCGGRFYGGSSLGIGTVPANPELPYATFIELPGIPFRNMQKVATPINRIFQVFVYDERGDFTRIDNILAAVRETMLGLVNEVDATTGARCLQSLWTGESQDITDDQHDSSVKFSLFQLTSTK